MRLAVVFILLWITITASGCGTDALRTSASPVPTQAMCPSGTTLTQTGPGIYICK